MVHKLDDLGYKRLVYDCKWLITWMIGGVPYGLRNTHIDADNDASTDAYAYYGF